MRRMGQLMTSPMRLAVLLVLTFGIPAQAAWAHGGGEPQLTNAQAGPYRVSVWTQPDPIRVGEMHLSVAVSEPPDAETVEGETGDLVLDATVRVQIEPMGEAGEALTTFATHEDAANKLFYEADVDVPAEGRWEVDILVEGPAGSGSASFRIEVLASSTFSTLGALRALGAPGTLWALRTLGALRWPVWGGLGLLLVTVGWSVHRFRGQEPEDRHA